MIKLLIRFLVTGVLLFVFVISTLIPSAAAAVVSLHKTWGGSGFDLGKAVAIDSLGNIYVAGQTSSFGLGPEEAIVLKYDSFGVLSWSRTWGGSGLDEANGIAVDSAGNVVVVGQTYGFGAGSSDVFILKFDASGDLLWQKTWGGNETDIGNAVAVDASGNIYVAGTTNSFTPSYFLALLLKFDASGNFLWALTSGTGTFEEALTVTVDSRGNIIFTGESYDYSPRGNILFFKLRPTLGLPLPLNSSIIAGSGSDFARGVSTDSSGNIYITGDTDSSGAGLDDVLLLKLNSNSALQWQRTWGGASRDRGSAVTVDPSGNIYVAGVTFSFGSGSPLTSDAVLLKFDSSGSLADSLIWGGHSSDGANGIALDSRGTISSGYVSEAPPYIMSLGNQTLGPSSLIMHSYRGGISYSTNITSRSPSGSLGFPSGAEVYSGGYDVFFLAYGLPIQSSPPEGPTASGGVSGISLSWSVPLANGGSPIASYRIFRGTSPGSEVFLLDVGNQTSYLDTSVDVGVTYYYIVTAVNSAGESNPSTEVSAMLISAPPLPQWVYYSVAAGVGVVSVAGVTYSILRVPDPTNLRFEVMIEPHSEILTEESER